jgi:hypothetical protein
MIFTRFLLAICISALFARADLALSQVAQMNTVKVDSFDVSSSIKIVDASHRCILFENEARCIRTRADYGPADSFKGFRQAKQIISGTSHNCVLDSDGVWCWSPSNNDKELLVVPPFSKTPELIATDGTYLNCAIVDEENVQCWGFKDGRDLSFNSSGTSLPRFKNPREFKISKGVGCAIDDEGVKCWAPPSCSYCSQNTFLIVPKDLKNPRHLSISSYGTPSICVVDDEKVKCWGSSGYHLTRLQLASQDDLKNIKTIVFDDNIACAIDSKRLHCWETFGGFQTPVGFKDPKSIHISRFTSPASSRWSKEICVFDIGRRICWHTNQDGGWYLPHEHHFFEDDFSRVTLLDRSQIPVFHSPPEPTPASIRCSLIVDIGSTLAKRLGSDPIFKKNFVSALALKGWTVNDSSQPNLAEIEIRGFTAFDAYQYCSASDPKLSLFRCQAEVYLKFQTSHGLPGENQLRELVGDGCGSANICRKNMESQYWTSISYDLPKCQTN